MEDLGSININIRELAGGGGGGSGSVGGGPSGMAYHTSTSSFMLGPLTRGQHQMVSAINRAVALMTRSVQTANDISRTITGAMVAFQQDPLKGIGFASSLKGELVDFFRAPSLGSYARLMQEGTATSAVLKSLGKTGMYVEGALMTVGMVGSVASVALGGLKKASEHLARRVEEVGKYSGPILAANIEQRMVQLQNTLQEAAENGELYARAIEFQTIELKTAAFFHRELGKITSGLSATFSTLKTAAYALGGGLVWLMNQLPRQTAAMYQRILTSTAIMGPGAQGWSAMLFALKNIDNNTKRRSQVDPKKINAWFQADILAMTGKVY